MTQKERNAILKSCLGVFSWDPAEIVRQPEETVDVRTQCADKHHCLGRCSGTEYAFVCFIMFFGGKTMVLKHYSRHVVGRRSDRFIGLFATPSLTAELSITCFQSPLSVSFLVQFQVIIQKRGFDLKHFLARLFKNLLLLEDVGLVGFFLIDHVISVQQGRFSFG